MTTPNQCGCQHIIPLIPPPPPLLPPPPPSSLYSLPRSKRETEGFPRPSRPLPLPSRSLSLKMQNRGFLVRPSRSIALLLPPPLPSPLLLPPSLETRDGGFSTPITTHPSPLPAPSHSKCGIGGLRHARHDLLPLLIPPSLETRDGGLRAYQTLPSPTPSLTPNVTQRVSAPITTPPPPTPSLA